MDNFDYMNENNETPVTETADNETSVTETADVEAAPLNETPNETPIDSQPSQKGRPFWRRAVAAVLALVIVGGCCGVTYHTVNHQWEQKTLLASSTIDQLNRKIDALEIKAANTRNEIVSTNLSYEGSMTPRQLYAANAHSVVAISSTVQTYSFGGQTAQGTSTGSGFILTDDGYIVTNHHVIDGATAVSVILENDEEYEATIVGYDSINDVAVLKIDAKDLPAVTLGSSDDLYIGDMVAAIGNPLGALTATLTVGYVSGKDRQVSTDSTMINMIQTDAAINAGNSGGPLFNMYGEVVGITTAKYSGTTSSGASIEGIGFAIPIDDVMSIIGDLRDFGYVTGAYLGVSVTNTDAAAASLYGLPTGAYVQTVVENGSADRAGVQEKDIIIKLGDYDVSGVSELTRTLRRFKANDTTTITVIRAGERKTLTITLDEKPRDLNNAPAAESEDMPQNGDYEEWFKYFFGEQNKNK